MADFEWYLNRQGARGQKGEKGDTGEAVSIEVVSDTANEYILKFVSASGEIVTPNLRGTLIDTAEEGTYVRYNPETQQVYTSDIEMASTTTAGAVRFTTEEELLDSDSGVAVSPSDMQDYLFDKLKEGKNITISKDEISGNITITGADGGYTLPPATQSTLGGIKVGTNLSITPDGTLSAEAGGVSDYNELTNKPQINSVELTGNKTLDDLDIQRKFNTVDPLSFETVAFSNYIGDISCDEETNIVSYKSPQNSLTVATNLFKYKGDVSALYGNAMLPDACLKFPISTDILYIDYSNGIVFAKTNPDGSFTPKIAIKNATCDIVGNWYQTQSDNTHLYTVTNIASTSNYDSNTPYGAYRLLYNEGIPTLYCCFDSKIYSYKLASSAALSALEDSDCVIAIPRFSANTTQNYGDLNSSTYDFGARTLTSDIAILPTKDDRDTLDYYYPSISLTNSFLLQASTATTSQLGVVKPDGTSITIDGNGTISAEVPTATSDLTNDSGFITNTVNNLTNYTPTSDLAAVATSGSYNDLTNKPTIPEPYTLPTASTTTLGGVKVDGTTVTIEDGVITAHTTGTGGTTDYTALSNKPQINSVELTGNKTLVDIGAQAITDNTLTTTNKTIVGAINELVTRIAALETQVTTLNSVIDGQTGGANNA